MLVNARGSLKGLMLVSLFSLFSFVCVANANERERVASV